MTVSRRDFLGAGAATAAGIVLPASAFAFPLPGSSGGPAASQRNPASPVVVASANGIRGVATAYNMITEGGDTLDAILAGVKIQELDPDDTSVGVGGLPNADGVIQLDASCMHGPTKRAGAVASLEGIATPSLVAKAVMDYTNHVLLVGPGAKRFALDMGFVEQDLMTPKTREIWLRWRSRLNPNDNWLDIDDEMRVLFSTGTINMNAVNTRGEISSVTTTSGLGWKIPGRVGDSPIVGAGQYCDNDVGAAGSTGRGESVIKSCGSFLIVEQMRMGRSPEQAILAALERIVATTEARLLSESGRPLFDVQYYAVAKDGRFAGGSLYEGSRYAVADAGGARLVDGVFLYRRDQRPQR